MLDHTRGKVLVVDDDFGMRVTLEAIMEDEGYEVMAAEDGYQALELAKDTPFDLVFMDIRMPGMNGVEAFREIKRVRPESVVVMMTGFSLEELVTEALSEGAYPVIYKPFEMEQIIEIVQNVLKTTCVLVVDDRVADRESLRVVLVVLEESGYRVFLAPDGEQAMAMASERHYDVVIMDVRMPGVNGFAAFEEIESKDPMVKVIFITGYELQDSAKAALVKGAYTVLTKPVDPEALLTLVGSLSRKERPE